MKVYWSDFALISLETIYKYYKENVSIGIAKNILQNILSCTSQLEKFPLSGTIEELLIELNENYRYIIRGNYKIIYKIQNNTIYITDIIDSRQNPEGIRKRNKNS